MANSPLFSILRDGVPEITVFGEVVAADDRKVCFQSSEAIGSYPARSLLKPFQFLAANADRSLWTTWLKGAVGSISASESQVEALNSYQKEIKPYLTGMKLPASYPMDSQHREKRKAEGLGPDPICHPCFSKHLAILVACEKNGWAENYLETAHPFHKELEGQLSTYLGRDHFEWVVDGCGLPSPLLNLEELAQLYFILVTSKENKTKALCDQMLGAPQWVGGPKRLDTLLMEENPGKVVAKEGADGLLGIGVLPNEKATKGMGIVVKLAGGYEPNQAMAAAAPLLEALGLKSVHKLPQPVKYHFKAFEKTPCSFIDLSPVVGPETAVFPGDVPFRRDVSSDTNKGQHLTLSSCNSTVHVGTHTDAPNHFAKGEVGIDQVELARYAGLCQVVEVSVGSGTVEPKNIQVPITAQRVLFKTGSFPDPNHFNEDFVALSPAVIKFLGQKGVVLVGIDTPSVDPCTSKTLDAHHETLRWKMGILEGLVLSKAKPGIYELMALPLRLEGADASPVRAVLLPTC